MVSRECVICGARFTVRAPSVTKKTCSEEHRVELIKATQRKPIRHGSTHGASSHYKRGEKPCADCRNAYREYGRARWRNISDSVTSRRRELYPTWPPDRKARAGEWEKTNPTLAKAARRRRTERTKTVPVTRRRDAWTPEEDAVIRGWDRSLVELATILGRSYAATQTRRSRLRRLSTRKGESS